MTKPTQIIELEKQLGFELRETKDIKDILNSVKRKIYCLNEKQVVIGLNLQECELTDLVFVQDFSALTHLNLWYNEITDYSYLEKLTSLASLNFGNNQITDCSFLEKLTNLTSIDSDYNQVRDIRFLEKLTNLTSLSFRENQITDIRFLENLISLTYLDLSNNQITDIRYLEKLTNLIFLDLNFNQISDYSFLKKLISLTSLNLSRNQITDIRYLEKLTSLTSIDLSKNQITDISLYFIRCFPQLEGLYLYANPIQNIPKEIFDKRGNVLKEVKNYLEDLEKGSAENKEIKVVFIGNGSVGKTQVAKRLVEQDKFVFNTQHASTHAIALLRRELAGFDLNCWDFAGQDMYHATHRLFLQTRALFVLVWDFDNETKDWHEWQGKKYNNEKLAYWLEYAQCFASESPILVVQNKIDAFPDDFYFEYQDSLQISYPIVKFLKVSAENGKGFKVLERTLKKAFETHQSFKTEHLPISWVMVRQEIRKLQEDETEKMLDFQGFQEICEYHRVEKSTETILDYLHNTGVLYYRKGYFQNQIIIQTDWAIQAVYKVLNRESDYFEVLEDNEGKLDYELICEIWENNTNDERALFIDFMLSAELAFETTKDKEWNTPLQDRSFIIPQLLPAERTNDVITWQDRYKPTLREVSVSYRFLPKVFIQRFIVKANTFSEVRLMWQDGILLRTTEGDALVVAVYEREKQRIEIHANNDFLVKQIIQELKRIEGEGKLKAKEGETETDKERFGLAALKPMNPNEVIIQPNPKRQPLNNKAELKNLVIEDGEFEEVFDILLEKAEAEELKREIELMKTKYSTKKQENRKGTISQEDFGVAMQRIRESLFEMIDRW